MVAAGAVVTHDVPHFALVVGPPAGRIGWVGHAGLRLEHAGDGLWRCPQTGRRCVDHAGALRPADAAG
jgi:hypothetical protein